MKIQVHKKTYWTSKELEDAGVQDRKILYHLNMIMMLENWALTFILLLVLSFYGEAKKPEFMIMAITDILVIASVWYSRFRISKDNASFLRLDDEIEFFYRVYGRFARHKSYRYEDVKFLFVHEECPKKYLPYLRKRGSVGKVAWNHFNGDYVIAADENWDILFAFAYNDTALQVLRGKCEASGVLFFHKEEYLQQEVAKKELAKKVEIKGESHISI